MTKAYTVYLINNAIKNKITMNKRAILSFRKSSSVKIAKALECVKQCIVLFYPGYLFYIKSTTRLIWRVSSLCLVINVYAKTEKIKDNFF